MKSVLFLFLIFLMILPLSAYATDSQINIKSVTSEQVANPFQIKHENGTILFAIYRDGVITAGTIPKERIQSSGTWSVSDIPTLPQSLITDLVSALSGKQAVVSGVSDTEIGWLDGVTSAIQTQLNGKQASGNYLTSPISESDVTNLVSDLSGKQSVVAGVSSIEIGWLDGVLSNIQDQFDSKESISSHNIDNTTLTNSIALKQSIISGVSDTEIGYLNGVTSLIQTQINTKESTSSHNADNSTITTALNSKESITDHDSDVSTLNSAIALKESISSHNTDNSTITTALNLKQDIVSGIDNTEIGYLNGLSSGIQNQLDSKQASISGLTSSGAELNILDGATLSTTELNYVDGVTSDIQSQINNKQSSLGFTPENIANKNIANGYASLNSDVLVPSINLGSGTNSSSTYLRGDRTWSVISGSGISEINTVDGGNARLSQTNSTTELVLKHFLDSLTISWTNNTNSVVASIVANSVDDAELGTGIDTTQLAGGGVTSTEFDFLADVTSLIQAQLNAKYSASNRQSSIVNSEISTVDTSKITTGTIDTARLGSGSATSSTYLRGDQTWATVSGGSAPRGGYLVGMWTQSTTKTNIGTSFVNVYTQTNSDGKAVYIDTDTFTTMRLQVEWNKVGSGTQSCQVITTGGTVAISTDVVSGTNDSGFDAIPAGLLNASNNYKIQCKSTTSADDPVFESASIWVK